jgi:hypothetical protein
MQAEKARLREYIFLKNRKKKAVSFFEKTAFLYKTEAITNSKFYKNHKLPDF